MSAGVLTRASRRGHPELVNSTLALDSGEAVMAAVPRAKRKPPRGPCMVRFDEEACYSMCAPHVQMLALHWPQFCCLFGQVGTLGYPSGVRGGEHRRATTRPPQAMALPITRLQWRSYCHACPEGLGVARRQVAHRRARTVCRTRRLPGTHVPPGGRLQCRPEFQAQQL